MSDETKPESAINTEASAETPAPMEIHGPPRPPMRAFSDRKLLLAAIGRMKHALPKRALKPILKNFMAQANGTVTLSAADLEVGVCLSVPGAQTLRDGTALLPAAEMLKVLRASKEKNFTIEADQWGCSLTGESARFTLPGADASEFPHVPEFQAASYHEIEADVLLEMCQRTMFAAAEGESARYAMTGVLWELEDDRVKLVATDGRRLALTVGPAKCVGGHTTKAMNFRGAALVPVKAMQLLEANLLGGAVRVAFKLHPVLNAEGEELASLDGSGPITMFKEAFFATEEAVIYSRLVDGRFPDYRQVFPRKPAATARVAAAALLAALKNASAMLSPDERRAAFRFEEGRLTLAVKGGAWGAASASELALPCQYDGKPVSLALNPGYLLEYVKTLPKKAAVEIALVDAATPVLFSGAEGSQYLVMPLS